MKTSYISFFFLSCLSFNTLQAQDSTKRYKHLHYLNFSVGPSFATLKNPGSTIEQKQDGSEIHHYKAYGYGKGLVLSLGYTLMLKKDLGLEVQASRFWGAAEEYKDVYYFTNVKNEQYRVISNSSQKANYWNFKLLLVGRLNYKTISPYFKAGILVDAGSKMTREIKDDVTFTNTGEKQNGSRTVVSSGGTNIGLNAVAGLDIKFSPFDYLFIELNFTGLKHKYGKYEVTESTQNGKDILSNYKQEDKSGNYQDDVPSTRSDKITYMPSLSSISIMAGLKIALVRK